MILLRGLGQAAQPADTFLPVSVWYAGGKARAPMLEPVTPASAAVWRKDLERIKSLVQHGPYRVEWTAGEPRQGEYHLEPLDLLLMLAEESGLKVIVQTYVDSAPDWVGVKYPESLLVAQNGQAIPSQSAPGFCFDHPGVREATLRFLQEVAKHAANSHAFFGWDLWSEPHIINWAEITYIPNASFCCCPHTLARFRQWLQKKYGAIPELNKAWYRQFQDWRQVEPPRFDTILSYTDYVDWRVFITQKIADDLRTRNDTVKRLLPERVTTSHAGAPNVLGSLAGGDGNPDDYLMYKAVDYQALAASSHGADARPDGRRPDPLRGRESRLLYRRTTGRLRSSRRCGSARKLRRWISSDTCGPWSRAAFAVSTSMPTIR